MNEMKQLNHDYLTINEVKDYLNISSPRRMNWRTAMPFRFAVSTAAFASQRLPSLRGSRRELFCPAA